MKSYHCTIFQYQIIKNRAKRKQIVCKDTAVRLLIQPVQLVTKSRRSLTPKMITSMRICWVGYGFFYKICYFHLGSQACLFHRSDTCKLTLDNSNHCDTALRSQWIQAMSTTTDDCHWIQNSTTNWMQNKATHGRLHVLNVVDFSECNKCLATFPGIASEKCQLL